MITSVRAFEQFLALGVPHFLISVIKQQINESSVNKNSFFTPQCVCKYTYIHTYMFIKKECKTVLNFQCFQIFDISALCQGK